MIYEDKTAAKRAASKLQIKNFSWNVPLERIYTEGYEEVKDATHHALQPCFIENDSSGPERAFTKFLEKNAEGIKWWYKNGDGSQGDFAVAYQDSKKETRSFYVDYLIMHQDGTIGLFDTKTKGSDKEAVYKHNALVEYMAALGKKVVGGILIYDGFNWKYPESTIANDDDLSTWRDYSPMWYKWKIIKALIEIMKSDISL